MGIFGSSPQTNTVLRLEARKSFSFMVRFHQGRKKPADLTDCELTFVMKAWPGAGPEVPDDSDNLIVNYQATIPDPVTGYAYFDFQATDLDVAPGEYPYAIVLRTAEGYSMVAIKGTVQVEQNTEFASLGAAYDETIPAQGLNVRLRGRNILSVHAGHILPPGMHYLTQAERDDLEELVKRILLAPPFGSAAYMNASEFAEAAAGIPKGGLENRVLTKKSNADFDVYWALPTQDPGTKILVKDQGTYTLLTIGGAAGEGGGDGIDPTGIPDGFVPTARGNDTWDWDEVEVPETTDDLTDGATTVRMTIAERNKLQSVEPGAEVNRPPAWAEVTGKPAFGTASWSNATAFAPAAHTHRFDSLEGVSYGITPPTGGQPGDIYIRTV